MNGLRFKLFSFSVRGELVEPQKNTFARASGIWKNFYRKPDSGKMSQKFRNPVHKPSRILLPKNKNVRIASRRIVPPRANDPKRLTRWNQIAVVTNIVTVHERKVAVGVTITLASAQPTLRQCNSPISHLLIARTCSRLRCGPKARLLQWRVRPPQAKNTPPSDASPFLTTACGREERSGLPARMERSGIPVRCSRLFGFRPLWTSNQP